MSNQNWDLTRLLQKFGLARTTDGQLFPPPLYVQAKTASYQILPTDRSGTIFTNRGAAGAVTFTLPGPTTVPAGTYYEFVGIADQNITVAAPTADTLVALNDAAADSVAMSTAAQKIGAHAKAICDGTAWIFVGDTVGVTYTAAT